MQKKHRIFIAINLPQDIKKYLAIFQKKWPDLPARWMSLDNLHITLSFLGYLTDIQLGEVCVAAKESASRHKSFEISLDKICYGPIDKNPPRMVWVMGKGSKELTLLKRDLENSLSKLIGFKAEKRLFNPHIALSRIKQLEFRNIEFEERPEVNENIDLKFDVESIEVMESKLKRTGPMYTAIESFSLKSLI